MHFVPWKNSIVLLFYLPSISRRCWSRSTTWGNCGWITTLCSPYRGWERTLGAPQVTCPPPLISPSNPSFLPSRPSSPRRPPVDRETSPAAVLGPGQEPHRVAGRRRVGLRGLRGLAAVLQHVAAAAWHHRYENDDARNADQTTEVDFRLTYLSRRI